MQVLSPPLSNLSRIILHSNAEFFPNILVFLAFHTILLFIIASIFIMHLCNEFAIIITKLFIYQIFDVLELFHCVLNESNFFSFIA